MKETVGSMRAYLGLGGFIVTSVGLVIIQAAANGPTLAYGIACTSLGGAYLVVGLRLRSLLIRRPAWVKGVLWVGIVWTAAVFVLGASAGGLRLFAVGDTAVRILINGYLLRNAARLSRELRDEEARHAAALSGGAPHLPALS